MKSASSSSPRPWRARPARISRSACSAARKAPSSARPSRAGPPIDRLDDVERLLDADGDVGEQLVGALDLRGRERRRARGVAADRVQVAEQRLHVALELVDHAADAAGHQAGRDDDADLRDGDGERRHRDDAEEDVAPDAHALSRRAC